MRGIVIARAHVALVLFAALSAVAPISAAAADAPVNILFVGNSFTHGRYEPVRTYNAGFSAGDVHNAMPVTRHLQQRRTGYPDRSS